MYALVDSLYGERGLIVAQLLLAVGLALTMQHMCRHIAGSFWFGALLGAYTAVSFHAHFSLRPQALVWGLFAVCLLLAERSRRAGLSGWQLFVVALLGCMWANTHVSGIVGLLSILVWHAQSGEDRAWVRRAGLMMGCFLLGTLITPYFGKEWLTALEVSGHVGSLKGLDEFQPATILQHSTGMLLLQVVLLGLLCFVSGVTPPVGALLVGVGTVLAGLGVVKFMPFAAITMSALLAVWWQEWRSVSRDPNTESPLVRAFLLGESGLNSLHPQTLGAFAFFISCLAWIYAAHSIQHPVNDVLIPKKSLAFLKQRDLPHPVLAEMGTGGLLMYEWSSPQGEPSYLVAVDGRTNVNSPAVWKSLQKALFGQEGWSEYIELVDPRTIVWRNSSPFVALLIESPKWCRVFQSGRSGTETSVFVTREYFDTQLRDLQSDDCSSDSFQNVTRNS